MFQSKLKPLCLIGVLDLCLLAGPAFAQSNDAGKLAEQATYWKQQGRADLAAESWRKVLLLQPDNADALLELGLLDVAAKRTADANRHLQQLQSKHPNAAQTARLRNAISSGDTTDTRLSDARRAAASGNAAEAVRLYETIFAGKTPSAALALEYYQALAATDDGWARARDGLRGLSSAGNNPRASLAYGQILTYRPASRAQGIAELRALAERPDVGNTARQSWRQALTWMGESASDAAAYREYLAKYPDDASIKEKLDAASGRAASAGGGTPARTAPPPDPRLQGGFRALSGGSDAEAERQFLAVLAQQPRNSEALGGLGSVRMRQGRFSEAVPLLERATAANGKWRSALNSARYWSLLGDADRALASGDRAAATAALQRAIAVLPNEAAGHAALGGALASSQPQHAEQSYRKALQLEPTNAAALQGLIALYSEQGRGQEAMQLYERLSPAQKQKLGDASKLRASLGRSRAQAALSAGDYATAQAELEMAMAEDSGNAWVRLDLARLYQTMGRPDQARNIIQGLMAVNGDAPESLYVYALMARENDDWAAVESALARIPDAQLDASMRQLQALAAIERSATQARALAKQGRVAQAQMVVAATEQQFANQLQDAEIAAALAGAWADASNRQRALVLAQNLLRGTPDIDARLQYAGVLARAGQDAELSASLRQLQTLNLNAGQMRRYQNLRAGYLLRQADAMREMGNLEGAYEMIAPVLAEQPHNIDAQAGLARMYAAAGQHPQALALYQRVLQVRPTDLDALTAAAHSAAAQSDLFNAEKYMQAALQQAPDSPDVLATAARIYRAAGKNRRAEQYYRAAIDAQQRQAASGLTGPGGLMLAGGGNPFAGMRGASLGVMPALPPISGSPGQPVVGAVAYSPPPASALPPLASGSLPAPAAYPATTTAALAAPLPAPAAAAYPPAYPAAAYPSAQAAGYPAAVAPPVSVSALQMPTVAVARVPMSGYALPAMQAPSAPPTLVEELREMRSENTSSLSAGAEFRVRDGEAGLSRTVDIRMPMKGEFAVGDGFIDATITPTLLDAGEVGSQYNTASRFGGGPASALASLLSANSGVIDDTVGSPLYARLLSDGNTDETRQLILDQAKDSGLYRRLYDAVVVVPTVPVVGGDPGQTRPKTPEEIDAERSAGAITALYLRPLSVFLLSQEMSRLTIGEIATLIGADRELTRDFTAAELAELRNLTSGVAAGMTAAELSERLYTMAATGGGHRRLSSDAAGAGVSVGFRYGGFSADIGAVPAGFRENNFVGGVGYKGQIGDVFGVNAEISQRAVTDSVLSYAGVEDPRTGMSWGGVTSAGIKLGANLDNGAIGGYLTLQSRELRGTNVADNTHHQLDSGFYVHALRSPSQSLTVGLNLTAMAYDDNLSGFTFGHGGYFSPQSYYDLSVPVHWIGQSYDGNVKWQVDSSIGYQHFKSDAAPYFPTDPALQQAAYDAASLAATLGLIDRYVEPVYPELVKTGLSYNFGAAGEWRLSQQLRLGGRFNFSNARDYRQLNTSFYLRYFLDSLGFGGQGGRSVTPGPAPAPLVSPFAGRN
ncbi:MAG: cellulose synthase subunit BcsC-related outer membrane protein [Pseudomonadota bacterium]|nr:cellulose synthase subunit BcsC-related outer membrane protein [Pseudomonadota bacterium]